MEQVVGDTRQRFQWARRQTLDDAAAPIDYRQAQAETDEVQHELPTARLNDGLPRNAFGQERPGKRHPMRSVGRGDDELRSLEVSKSDLAFSSQRMLGRHDQHLLDLGELRDFQIARQHVECRHTEVAGRSTSILEHRR